MSIRTFLTTGLLFKCDQGDDHVLPHQGM